MVTIVIQLVFLAIQSFVMWKFIIPKIVDREFEARVKEYVGRAVNELQKKTKEQFDATDALIAGNNRKIATILTGYKEYMMDMDDEIKFLFSLGQDKIPVQDETPKVMPGPKP